MASAIKNLLFNRRGPLLAAALYWAGIELSWNLAEHQGTYIAFWLPAGIFLGLLIASEISEWRPLCSALVVTNVIFDFTHGAHLGYAAGMAISDLTEACVGALIFRRFFPVTRRIATLREFLGFVLATVFGVSLGGVAGALTQVQFGFSAGFFAAWKTWALGDGMAAVVVAPVVFEWILKTPPLRRVRLARWLEATALALGLGLSIIYLHVWGGGVLASDKSVIIPFLLWAALRFGPRGVALINLFATLMVIYLSRHFAPGLNGDVVDTHGSLPSLQIFLAVCSAVGFVSSFALSERNDALQDLKDSEERLRTLTIAANEAVMICEGGRIIDVNTQGLQLFRGAREDLIGKRAIDFIDGEAKATVAAAIDSGRELVLHQRLRRKDGTMFDGESHGKQMRIGGRDLRLTTIRDISEQKRDEQFLVGQARILEMIAKGFDCDVVVARVLAFIQEQAPDLLGLALIKDGHDLRRFGGQELPEAFVLSAEKFFGTIEGATWLSLLPATVTVENVTSGPLWACLLEPGSYFPKTCWSLPVARNGGERLGAFLFFSKTPTVPDAHQRRLLEIISYLVSLVIERDAGEKARDQASSLMRAAFEATTDAVLVVDKQGRVSAFNQNFIALWGLPPEIIESRSHERALQHVLAQLVDPKKFLARVTELYAEPERESFDLLYFRNGRIVERASRPQRLGERIVGRVWSFRDVTERTRTMEAIRLSEERFRLTFESAGTGMALLSLDRGFVQVNSALCDMLGYRADELMRHSLIELTHPDDRARDTRASLKLLAGEERVYRTEKRYRHRNGDYVWATVVCTLLLAADGTPQYFSTQIKDETERKQLEQAMRENERKLAVARDQAIEASRLKSEFLATMSHEIRTPMNAIIGMTSLLTATKLDRQQNEMAHLVTNAAENLLTIINDILDFSRIEAGFLRIEPKHFDFHQLLNDTVSLLNTRAQPKSLQLRLSAHTLPEGLYFGDADRIRQVLTNLIGNAIKFTDSGSVHVESTVLSDRGSECLVRINVVDTGIGIPAEKQGKLFQPFVQVDGSSTRRFGGTGLGLAITRQLVEAMGGTIGLQSEPGVGSTFWFELKMPRQPLVRSTVASEPKSVAKRILYVDDDDNDRELISHHIRQCGYDIQVAATAATALDKVRAADARFDLILLDWKMPGMDGFELAKRLRGEANASKTPFAMLSSMDRPIETGGAANDSEFAAFISKSIERPRLAQSLHHLLTDAAKTRAQETPAAAHESVRAPMSSARRLKILVAEDNEINQRVGTLMLMKMGHDAYFVGDGQAAVDRLNEEIFDVVLMDCQMPLLDGYEATRLVRSSSKQPNIPIIALTAYARDEDRDRCLNAGMTAYISKPMRMENLQRVFEQCGLGAGPQATQRS